MVASNENSAASNEFVSSVGGKSSAEPGNERDRERRIGRGRGGQDSVREKKLRTKQDVQLARPEREREREGEGRRETLERMREGRAA